PLVIGTGAVGDGEALAIPRVPVVVRDSHHDGRAHVAVTLRALVEPRPRQDDRAFRAGSDPLLVIEEAGGVVEDDHRRVAPRGAAVLRDAYRNPARVRVAGENDVRVVQRAVGAERHRRITGGVDLLEVPLAAGLDGEARNLDVGPGGAAVH